MRNYKPMGYGKVKTNHEKPMGRVLEKHCVMGDTFCQTGETRFGDNKIEGG